MPFKRARQPAISSPGPSTAVDSSDGSSGVGKTALPISMPAHVTSGTAESTDGPATPKAAIIEQRSRSGAGKRNAAATPIQAAPPRRTATPLSVKYKGSLHGKALSDVVSSSGGGVRRPGLGKRAYVPTLHVNRDPNVKPRKVIPVVFETSKFNKGVDEEGYEAIDADDARANRMKRRKGETEQQYLLRLCDEENPEYDDPKRIARMAQGNDDDDDDDNVLVVKSGYDDDEVDNYREEGDEEEDLPEEDELVD